MLVLEDVSNPVVNAGTDQTLTCLTTSLNLDGSGSSSGVNFAYQWSTTDGNIVSGATTTSPEVNQPGTYILEVTNTSNGCSLTDNVLVNADITLPTASAGSDQEICSDEISSIGAASNPDYSYSWFPATGLSNSNISNPDFQITNTASSSETYNIVLTVIDNTNGCTSTDDFAITVFPEVSPDISISASETDICEGDPVTFTSVTQNEGSSPAYSWLVNGTPVGSSASFSGYAFQDGDIVSCVLTSSELCTDENPVSSNQIVMNVGSTLPVDISILQSPAGTICEGETLTFTASPQNGGDAPSYTWQQNGTTVGSNSTVYSSGVLSDGDVIYCILFP